MVWMDGIRKLLITTHVNYTCGAEVRVDDDDEGGNWRYRWSGWKTALNSSREEESNNNENVRLNNALMLGVGSTCERTMTSNDGVMEQSGKWPGREEDGNNNEICA